MQVKLHLLYTSALDGGEWSALCSCRLSHRGM